MRGKYVVILRAHQADFQRSSLHAHDTCSFQNCGHLEKSLQHAAHCRPQLAQGSFLNFLTDILKNVGTILLTQSMSAQKS